MNKIGFGWVFLFIVAGCGGSEKKIQELNENLDLKNPTQKIWLHRLNGLGQAENRLKEFDGIEIDIFYEPKLSSFEVKHDDDGIGVDLEFFLDSVLKIKPVMIWIDYKNLNKNTDIATDALFEIIAARNLQHRCFIESNNVNGLKQLNGRLATSFWVEAVPIPESAKERTALFESRFSQIKDYDFPMLSTSFEMFDFMQEYFPNRRCNYWMIGQLDEKRLHRLNEMANTPNVNVILIDGNDHPLK